jgi:hypothetical protein
MSPQAEVTLGAPRILAWSIMNKSAALVHRGPPLAIVTAVVFSISSVFPVIAGLSLVDKASSSKWWGIVDVGIAFFLGFLAIVIVALVGDDVTKEAEAVSYRAYRILSHGLLVMIVVFFLFGDRIVWINCLTGFAWRTWLLFYTLPAWFTAFGGTAAAGWLPGNSSRA